MSILTAPFYALFSLDFYKRVLRTPLSSGFLYLAILAGFATLGFFVMIQMRVLPAAEEIVVWAKQTMPPLVWSPDGLALKTSEPTYVMYHPEYGNAVVFDMEKTQVSQLEMGNTILFVTRAKAFYNTGKDILTYDLRLPADAANRNQVASVVIGPDALDQFFGKLKSWSSSFGLVIIFGVFYLGKLLFAFLCSGFGVFMNQTRQIRLPYEKILLVTFFALTAQTLVEFVKAVIPGLQIIPFGLLGSLLLTIAYVYLGIVKTDEFTEAL